MISRGRQVRKLETNNDQRLRLDRTYTSCPRCGVGIFPLDEELGLLSGTLTPRLQQSVVRVGREWTEVKTLAVGEVTLEQEERSGEQVIKTLALSYFSHRSESD